MSEAAARSRQVLIAGGGIAGLCAALAFSACGIAVRLFERAEQPHEIGAGLQLSPNATRILDHLGVLHRLRGAALQPEAVVLRGSSSMAEIARVPLGRQGEERWGAPYLVVHRADLHAALLSVAKQASDAEIVAGATVRDAAAHGSGVTVSVDLGGKVREFGGQMMVIADGVWSSNRRLVGSVQSAYSGRIAWRATLRADAATNQIARDCVTAFLHPNAHLIAYPIRGGQSINLAAFAKGAAPENKWSAERQPAALLDAFASANPAIIALLSQAGPWTVWPIHTVDVGSPWVNEAGFAVIGDAAHAMTPFAAQGAAMAIEDAFTLAACVAAQPGVIEVALRSYERARRARVQAVARRGRLNEFAWHASGPVGIARNQFLKLRGPDRLAADMDWLYGWAPPGISR